MNYKLFCMISTLLFSSTSHAEIIKTNDLLISIKKLNSHEKRQIFSCLNPIKSRHLTAKYTLFELKIKNKSSEDYLLDAQHSNLEIMSPERIAQRVEINRTWIPVALATCSAVLLSSIFYIAYVPCFAISVVLGACAATVNPHKTAQNNKQKMLSSILDAQHELIIPSCHGIKKVIAVRTRKNRGKAGTLFLKKKITNLVIEEAVEIKIPCV